MFYDQAFDDQISRSKSSFEGEDKQIDEELEEIHEDIRIDTESQFIDDEDDYDDQDKVARRNRRAISF